MSVFADLILHVLQWHVSHVAELALPDSVGGVSVARVLLIHYLVHFHGFFQLKQK